MVIKISFISILALAFLTYFFIYYLTVMMYIYLPGLALPCWLWLSGLSFAPLIATHCSSLFPLPAGAAAEEASTVRRLLPPFVTAADYLGRVILLTGSTRRLVTLQISRGSSYPQQG